MAAGQRPPVALHWAPRCEGHGTSARPLGHLLPFWSTNKWWGCAAQVGGHFACKPSDLGPRSICLGATDDTKLLFQKPTSNFFFLLWEREYFKNWMQQAKANGNIYTFLISILIFIVTFLNVKSTQKKKISKCRQCHSFIVRLVTVGVSFKKALQ